MKIVVTHSSDFDFVKNLYIPLRNSPLKNDHDFLLPQENGKREVITRDIIKNADKIIAEVSRPSTGQGIELGWADIYRKPIICLYQKGSKISNSLQFIAKTSIEYENSEDMIAKLTSVLK